MREKNSHAVDTPRFKLQMAVFSTSPAWFCSPNSNTKFDGKLRDVREIMPRSKKEKKIEKNLSRDVAVPTGPTDASPGVEKRIIQHQQTSSSSHHRNQPSLLNVIINFSVASERPFNSGRNITIVQNLKRTTLLCPCEIFSST